MTAVIAPRFSQHKEKVILRFEKQKWSYTSCEMRVFNEASNVEIFHTKSWDTFRKRQFGITCIEPNGKEALLYIVKEKTKMFRGRTYHLVEEGDTKGAFFSAESIGYSGHSNKNDFAIEYSAVKGRPLSKLWITKCDIKPGVMDILGPTGQVLAQIMRNKPERHFRPSASVTDEVTAEVKPGVDLSLITLCVMVVHFNLVARHRERSSGTSSSFGSTGGGFGGGGGGGC